MWSQLCKLQNSVSFHPFKIEEHYGHKQSETAAKEPNTRSAKRSEVYDSGLGAKTSKAEADGCGWGTLLAGGGTGAGTEGWSRFGACHERRVFARVESQYFSSPHLYHYGVYLFLQGGEFRLYLLHPCWAPSYMADVCISLVDVTVWLWFLHLHLCPHFETHRPQPCLCLTLGSYDNIDDHKFFDAEECEHCFLWLAWRLLLRWVRLLFF